MSKSIHPFSFAIDERLNNILFLKNIKSTENSKHSIFPPPIVVLPPL